LAICVAGRDLSRSRITALDLWRKDIILLDERKVRVVE
jgi:hypothetical protein